MHVHVLYSLTAVVVESVSSLTVYTGESTEAELVCAVYGYLRDSSSPVWTHGSDPVLDGDRISITVTSASLLSGSSISSTNRVESHLTISNVTEEDTGEYTCSVQGNSSSITLTVESGKFISCWLLDTCTSIYSTKYLRCKIFAFFED